MSFEILKKRALAFLRDAKEDFNKEDYDLVMFHVEQFIQLYAKYLLYRKLGDFPKMHSIIKLLRDLARVYNACEIDSFIERKIESLYLLEEAYISSRYIPREYDREIALKTLGLAGEILEVFKCLESQQ